MCGAAEGSKDQVLFLSEEEEAEAVGEAQSEMDDAVRQAVKDDGEIDWECPCLQGMAQGPCGDAFKVRAPAAHGEWGELC